LRNETADPDNDGYRTWQEYICNTDPTNAHSRLDLSIATNTLAFTTASNRIYAVRTCGRLGDPSPLPWTTPTNLPGTGNSILLPLNTTTSAFYRVEVSLP
jgi:hypothetical protein